LQCFERVSHREVIMEKHFRTIVGGRSAAYEGLKKYPGGIEILLEKEWRVSLN
jgi:hypothetical protein